MRTRFRLRLCSRGYLWFCTQDGWIRLLPCSPLVSQGATMPGDASTVTHNPNENSL
jgi:hypothetical protein